MSKQRKAVWSEALAIQAQLRELEIEALSAYMTAPGRLDSITERLAEVTKAIAPMKRPGVRDCGCDPGWCCCCGRCRPGLCAVCMCPPAESKPGRKARRVKKTAGRR